MKTQMPVTISIENLLPCNVQGILIASRTPLEKFSFIYSASQCC